MDVSLEPAAGLDRPLPSAFPGEPPELAAYRRTPGDEKTFVRLRRAFRDAENWRALATLLVLHAAHIEHKPEAVAKAAELCIQASELWLERVKDRKAAAHALARAVVLRPDQSRGHTRLRKLYESMSATKELVALLRWRLHSTTDPAQAAALHVELAGRLREDFVAVGEAVSHYEQALQLSPGLPDAVTRLVEIYLGAGAFLPAAAVIEAELSRAPGDAPEHAANLHRRLAKIDADVRNNVPGAARHLQSALELVPGDIDALRAFGELYLGSTAEGTGKAADIFYKAADLARRQKNHDQAIKLLRRALSLVPDHQQAATSLESTLVEAQDWLALDDLYHEWLLYDQSATAVPLMLRRADLLDSRLHRREEARLLFEEASRHEPPDGESWRRLEDIYSATGDVHALAALLEVRAERIPDQMSTASFLRLAKIYREDLGNHERAAVFYYEVLEREPFNSEAFEGYKDHWRRKHHWTHLRGLIDFQIDRAIAHGGQDGPLADIGFAEEFVELADIYERRLGDVEQATLTWQRMAEYYPGDARPAKSLARIEKRSRMWENMKRVQEDELSRTVDPRKRLDILKRLTQLLRDRQSEQKRAIELYREILELSPGDVQATRALTALYDRKGDYDKVSQLLRGQYERSRSPTEQSQLLRRLADIWHYELKSYDQAIWAYETILERSPADRNALLHLQHILETQQQYPELLDALQRELEQAGNKDTRVKVLRRMARVAEHQLGDEDQAASIWTELFELLPGNLELTDKIISLYESSGRYEELGTVLKKASVSPQTPEIRQVDYLLRLAQLAESSLDDAELARTCFEKVLRSRPDHRGALEALVRLYREDEAWGPLVRVLGRLQSLAETDDDAFRIAWERSEILSDSLDDANGAVEVLEALSKQEFAQGNQDIARTLLELYERGSRHRDVIRQAELMLLATTDASARHGLYKTVVDTWVERLEDKPAALVTYRRLLEEFTDDTEGMQTMAGLQVDVGDNEGALATLQRRLDLLAEPLEKTATLSEMSRIAEKKIGDGARALDLLRRALAVDHYAEEVLVEARRVAEHHKLWRELLGLFDERFVHMGTASDVEAQIEVCFEASEVAEHRYGDAEKAFDWARRGFFVAVENDRSANQGDARLRELAAAHHLWNPMLGVIEEEIASHERRGTTDDGRFDLVRRLEQAADLALERLDDASRAVGYLQRAHRQRPDDERLAQRLEQTARQHRLWTAVIEFFGQKLERTTDAQGRFDACIAIANVYEQELDDPEKAFEWLRTAWVELRERDTGLAQEAIERLLALSKRHSLWAQLANHHLLRAKESFTDRAETQGLACLRQAALVFDRNLEDPLGALRVLASGLSHDPGGNVLLPDIRTLGAKVDERRAGDVPPLGALLHLEVLRKLLAASRSEEETLRFLEERAELREMRLDDLRGAMAEWLRVVHLRPDDDQALVELERLAEDADAWDMFMVLPGWRLDRATSEPRAEASILRQMAQLYEGVLERPEYALRARLEAWRREPELPVADEPLDDTHAAIWRLAEQTGAYRTPPVPKDPLLRPTIEVPEFADLRIWTGAGLDPEALLGPPPSPFAAKLDVSSPQAILRTVTEDISLPMVTRQSSNPMETGAPELTPRQHTARAPVATPPAAPPPAAPPGAPVPVRTSGTMEIEEIEEFEDIELLEADDEELEGTVASEVSPQQVNVDQRTRTSVAPKAPPPPPRTPDAGMPALPRLPGNLLPARPRVASAWEEVAHTYASAPTRDKAAQVTVALVLARLWEHGAKNLERAFAAHEQALLIVPEDPVALQGLESLAERHNTLDRLLQADQRLLAEATLPRHLIAQNLRIAKLHETRDNVGEAEKSYRAVLAVAPRHIESLESLLRIHSAEEQPAKYADVLAELIEAQRVDWPESELVERSLELATLLHSSLGRTDDALEHLQLLVRQCPTSRASHDELIQILLELERWQPAIEAMRVAWTTLEDDEFRLAKQAKAAEIYETQLKLPDRALATLQLLAETPEDLMPQGLLDDVLAAQQRLYRATSRTEDLVQILERRLDRLASDDEELRIELLVDKARVLQDGMGDDAGATAALERLNSEVPGRDEVITALSELYRKTDRYEDGVTLLREHWQTLSADSPRSLALAITLCDVMTEEGGDARGAQQVVTTALESHRKDPGLLDRRVAIARSLADGLTLADALQARGSADDLLEAAGLLQREIKDGARAMRLFSRVLADAKRHTEAPDSGRHLAVALEGLVQLRIADGDTDGAMEFMDKQLAEVEGPAIRALLLTEMGRITYRGTGDMEAARKRFDEALKEDPEHAAAKLGLARILVEADEIEDAEALLTAAVEALSLAKRQHDLVDALVLLAEVLERTGRAPEAYRRLTAALRHDADNLEIRAAVVRNRHRAGRHRDAVTAVEQIEQKLADHPLPETQRRKISQTFVLAARSEEHLKSRNGVIGRYRRAAELDPDNPEALEPLVNLCQERGFWTEAAVHALALAKQTEEQPQRTQRFVDAALLYFDAAAAVADAGDPDSDDPDDPTQLGQLAMQAMRSGLDLAQGHESALVERGAWEAAFRHTAPRDAVTALRVLERLFRHRDLAEQREHDLLLEGVRLALAAGERLELAERYAFKARQLLPASSAAVLAHAEVFQATDRVQEIEPLVESFFKARGDEGNHEQERHNRVALLLRLAELQASDPEKAAASLQRAATLSNDALGADHRRTLARLYTKLDRRDEAALQNHRCLLEHDPLFVPSLSALAKHYAENGELDHARATFAVIALVDGDHAEAQAFLDAHQSEQPKASDGAVSEDWLATLRSPAPPDAGVGEALLQLWDGGGSLLAEHMPKIEVSPDARVSPLADGLVPQTWAKLLKRLGQSKVALVDVNQLDEDEQSQRPDAAGDSGYFHVRWQNPPVILVEDRAWNAEHPAELQFALGRAMYFTRPEAVFATGLQRVVLAQLLSSTFQAFHPRHMRRRHHARGGTDEVGRFGQELARKLPVKVSRRLGNVFKAHEDEPFDSQTWRSWVRRCGNRVGLALGGDLTAALRVLNDGAPEPHGEALREWAANDGDVRDLLTFAASPAFVAARRELGVHVIPTAEASAE